MVPSPGTLRRCKPLSDAYEALWSPSCDSMWSLTLARAGRASGAEKFSSPARKPFFDSIGPERTFAQRPSCKCERHNSLDSAAGAGTYRTVVNRRRTHFFSDHRTLRTWHRETRFTGLISHQGRSNQIGKLSNISRRKCRHSSRECRRIATVPAGAAGRHISPARTG